MRFRGFSMVLVASLLWGVSGTVAQSLLQHYHFTTEWLVAARLLLSGAVLLLLSLAGDKRQNVWKIVRSGPDFGKLVIFALFGLLAVQYTYFASIELGNAATATLLQYLGPVFLTGYLVARNRQLPSVAQMLALFLALLGTFLLITNGNPGNLSISTGAVLWGLASAVALAFYTLYPKKLLERWGATVVLGWGMLIGGIGLCVLSQPWQATGQIWMMQSVLAVGFLVLFGTLIAFYLYLDSLRFILPSETSILASAEPLSAVVATVVWLHVPFGLFEWLGAFCIVGTVFALANHKEKKAEFAREQHI
ncbi:DMT family transporter [Brevibacillus invocatus]|uniref:DMT family transporter n=1 Tax=Brevibacillus invocatus TaxID=173959 RepID=UPI00203E40EF|nr:EamA family transporter [Brevibacillus invocatus]MCM3079353.1 EamA family transporter [Brevibacillus invocatus]MCM3429449.1 EamA family transporter [Brevibacillus invocatus]